MHVEWLQPATIAAVPKPSETNPVPVAAASQVKYVPPATIAACESLRVSAKSNIVGLLRAEILKNIL